MTSASFPAPSRTASAPRVSAASAPAARAAVACVRDAALPAGPWCGHAHHHVWN